MRRTDRRVACDAVSYLQEHVRIVSRPKKISKTYKYLAFLPYTVKRGSDYSFKNNLIIHRTDYKMDASLRNSAMSILEGTHYMFEAAELKMEHARQLYRHAEEACKSVNDLASALNQQKLSKEAKLMQGVIKKLEMVVEKRGEELSTASESYLDMKDYLLRMTCQVISEVGNGSYGPIPKTRKVKA